MNERSFFGDLLSGVGGIAQGIVGGVINGIGGAAGGSGSGASGGSSGGPSSSSTAAQMPVWGWVLVGVACVVSVVALLVGVKRR